MEKGNEEYVRSGVHYIGPEKINSTHEVTGALPVGSNRDLSVKIIPSRPHQSYSQQPVKHNEQRDNLDDLIVRDTDNEADDDITAETLRMAIKSPSLFQVMQLQQRAKEGCLL